MFRRSNASLSMAGGSKPLPSTYRNVGLLGALALVMVLSGVLIWQLFSAAALQQDINRRRAELAQEQTRELDVQARQLLRASAALLALAVADPLAAGDYSTIDQRIRPLVREELIFVVAVVDQEDRVRSATNHKLEGQTLDEAFPGLDPTPDSGVAVIALDRGLVALAPIMAAGRSVGRAVIYYSRER